MKDKKKKNYKKPEAKACFYCGSVKIEQIRIGSVSIARCKDCGEPQD